LHELPPGEELRQIVYRSQFPQLIYRIDEAGDVFKRHHSTAVGQQLAFELQDAAIAQPEPGLARLDVVGDRIACGLVEPGPTSVLENIAEGVGSIVSSLGKSPHAGKSPVQESHIEVAVQDGQAKVDFIKRRLQSRPIRVEVHSDPFPEKVAAKEPC